MINLTNNIIFLKHGEDLDEELKTALIKVYKSEVKYSKRFDGKDRKRSYQEKQFTERCNPKDIKDKVTSELFINTAMDAVHSDRFFGTKTTAARVNKFLTFFEGEGVPVRYLPSIRRPIARLLIELRSAKCITLPMYFPALNYIPHFDGRYPSIDGMAVYKCLMEDYQKTKNSGKSTHQISAMVSFVLASDWDDADDISLNDLGDYHRADKGYVSDENISIPKTRMSKTYFINRMKSVSGELSFTQDDIDVFLYWISSSALWCEKYSFDYYYNNLDELTNKYEKEFRNKRKDSNEKYLNNKARTIIKQCDEGKITHKEAITVIYSQRTMPSNKLCTEFLLREECLDLINNDQSIIAITNKGGATGRLFLSDLARKGQIDDYYINLSKVKRAEEWASEKYPGVEHLDTEALSQHWTKLYKFWIEDRYKEGYESLSSPKRAITVLLDYICLYIPLWIEANPDANIETPIYPKDFDRFTFVHRDYYDDIESVSLPSTYYDMLNLRFGKDSSSSYQLFQTTRQFFIFLYKKRRTLSKYVGKDWSNPIEETDKFKSGARAKTPKVAFEEEASPWILRYFYALNNYGLHLQKLALESNYFSSADNSNPFALSEYRMIDTENEFEGYVPVINGCDINGNEMNIRLTEIPNVFTFSKRLVQQKDGTKKEIMLPELSNCRANITMYETGRRNSNTRHLCRDTWDELNTGCDDDEMYFELNVNTDKTQNKGQIEPAPMLSRLRTILKQEEEYQNLLSLTETHKKVTYQNRKEDKTRFDSFVPLFRTANTDKPISDQVVRKCFGWMVYGVQKTLNENRISDFDYKWVSYDDDNKIVVLPKEMNTHTFRANFISDRFPFFPDDINILTSQSNLQVSGHYYRPSRRDIKNRFIEADNKIHGLSNEYDIKQTSASESFDGSVHLHPSSPNSALRKSWEEDRDETIRRFRFVMINTLPAEVDKESQRGLEILRVSASNQIKWFDTHACPVNMQCPDNIIQLIGSSHRCGICPIAAKCVDHVPAIRAERRAIGSRIIQANELIKKLRDEKAEISIIRKVQKDKQLDSIEFSGWQAAEKYLNKALNTLEDSNDVWHVQMPEMVRLHLDMVVPPSSSQSYLLERVSAVQAYPSLTLKDPTLESRTKMLALKIANDQGLLKEVLDDLDSELVDSVNLLANSMSVMMKARGIKPEQLYAKIKSDEGKLLVKPVIKHQDDTVEPLEDE